MKRVCSLLLTAVLLLSLCACGGTAPAPAPEPTAAPTAAPTPTPTPEPTPNPEELYAEAEALLASGDFAAAEALFASLGDYSDAADRVRDCRCRSALAQARAGDTAGAREALAELDEADSAGLLLKLDALDTRRALRGLTPGNTFFLGVYDQDNKPDTDPEPIEWMVIVDKGDQKLAVSRYCLESMRFHNERGDVVWKDCSLRAWLNGDFFENAFDEREKLLVPLREIDNSEDNGRKGTDSGDNTFDHVFLLSYHECVEALVYTHAETIWDFQTTPTQRAKDGGAATGKFGGCWWWLRTAGKDARFIEYVDFNGIPWQTGFQATHEHGCVRPAIWLDLSDNLLDE